ncbi:prephenate dehydratase [Bacillus mangrovi]|uniref:Prephenate dehydratase n=1 Tax=Metabacillus mangrovi TaxID=1491830 RepID=A0A7X2V4D3_9BACI|nr:prephenate dehydratase [Metabacillus mangrovi]MTH52996.1 prephenate dehydratase [Metabacillus mangrovi]
MSYRIGFLGPEATFTHLAVSKFFHAQTEQIPYATIPACMDAVAGGDVDFAIVPLENAIEGSVNLTVDYLVHEQPLHIVGELVVPINQHLMVHPSRASSWRDLEKIISHSHAIAQCHRYLHKEFPKAEHSHAASTGAAARHISLNPHENAAVIANEMASEVYGLTIVERDIHDYHYNHTLFAILHPSMNEKPPTLPGFEGKDKTTIMVTLPSDQAGTLHQVLSAFSWRKLNMSKIESRPMKTGLGNYFFLIDLEHAMDGILIPGAISELEALGCGVKVLGSYKAFFA